jgi:integrase
MHGIKSPLAGLRFHDPRHSAITKLSESQASDQTIMAIAGHLSREMLEHYNHVRLAAKRAALEAISTALPNAPAHGQLADSRGGVHQEC